MKKRNRLIVRLNRTGYPIKQLAKDFNLSESRIRQILNEVRKKEVWERDDHECLICGNENHLKLYHINGNSKDTRKCNLVVLCKECRFEQARNNRFQEHIKTKMEPELELST